MKYTIYHNPRCRKSRAGLEYLKNKGVEAEVRLYLSEPLDLKEFELLLAKLNLPASEMIRTQEEVYKNEYKGKNFTEDEWKRIILKHPNLLKRPIVVRDNKAVWGDPVENIDPLFK